MSIIADVPASEDPWTELRRYTSARIALGRSGTSLSTASLLEFDLAHAKARDAVHMAMQATALRARLAAMGLACQEVHSAAKDRHQYLLRPDLGRRLDSPSVDALHSLATASPAAPDLLLVIADGLSCNAVHRNATEVCQQILGLAPDGWSIGPAILAHQGRVALGDHCGELLGARMVAVLIGERPGLSASDSLGIYLTHAPRLGLTDANRNCISNIHAHGLSPRHAAHKLWWLANEANRIGETGVHLKDESPGLSSDNSNATNVALEQ